MCKEQKISRAKYLHANGHSYRQIGLALGVCHETIRRWLNPTVAQKNLRQKRERYNAQPIVIARKQDRRKRAKFSPHYWLSRRLRSRLYNALKGRFKAGSAVQDLGCSIERLKEHLESQFQGGMNWDNHGKWHIDHKKPLASFDLTDRQQFLEACHFTNLQPLWAKKNMSKGSKRG